MRTINQWFGRNARRTLLLGPILVGLQSLVAPVSAQTVEEIAQLSGPDREATLIEGAKKEGKVVLYTSLIVDQIIAPLEAAFEAKYPFIDLQYVRAASSDILQRVLAEQSAGNPQVDVIAASVAASIKKSGFGVPFTSPLQAEYPPQYIPEDHLSHVTRTSFQGIAWNTKLVTNEEAPKTWEDLLDPKWKGKMVWSQSPETGAPFIISYWRLIWGEDKTIEFLEKLRTQDVRTMSGSVRSVLDQVIAGEFPIGISMAMHHVAISEAEGAPIAGTSPEPVFARTGSVSVIKGAPDPHAAMLLIDFMLSKEGQTVLRDAKDNPTLPEVDPLPEMGWFVPRLTGAKEIVEDPVQMEDMTARSIELYEQYFK